MSGGRRYLAGRYKFDRALSTDSSGTLYKAKDLRSGADVTVKELSPALVADSAYMERIRASAAALTGFDDPNFVSVIDFIEAGGQAYVVSVYVEGQSLRDVIGSAAIAPAEALALLRGSLLGLAAVNSAGLLHRSVRPENVILLPDGQVKLTGFDQPAYAGAAAASGSGVSPYAYIAPEQVVGATADPRTDVYLAGLLGYELLAGVPPFTASDPSQVMSMHVAQDPVPLSAVRPEIPVSVADVVSQALAKEPDDRQQGARSFIAQIDAAGPSLGPAWALALVPGSLASLLVPPALPQPAAPTPAPRRVPMRVAPRLAWSRRGALVPGAAALSLALTGGAAFAYSQRWLGNGVSVPASPRAGFTASTGVHPGGVPGGLHPYVVPPTSNPSAQLAPTPTPTPTPTPSPTPSPAPGPGAGSLVAVIPVVARVAPGPVVPPITGNVVPPAPTPPVTPSPPVTPPAPTDVDSPVALRPAAIAAAGDHDSAKDDDKAGDKGRDRNAATGHQGGGDAKLEEHKASD
jgi:hypothetical protein